jgi:hypothetical protein
MQKSLWKKQKRVAKERRRFHTAMKKASREKSAGGVIAPYSEKCATRATQLVERHPDRVPPALPLSGSMPLL